jgi:protein-disulfide isomerase
MKNLRNVLLDVITVATAVTVLGMAVTIFLDRDKVKSISRESRVVDDWQEIAASGHREGPVDPQVTIIEFGDYECPACRAFEEVLRRVTPIYKSDVAVVYRHWPLSYHKNAYAAARAAECAGDQGQFKAYHSLLYSTDTWMQSPMTEFARLADTLGLPDRGAFDRCVNNENPHPRIEEDIEAVQLVGSSGTPTIIVDGTLLASVPDSTQLVRLIDKALKSRERR